MGKKLAFWGDCNGCGYKIIRILEELGGINVTNYCGAEVTSLYYIDEKNCIKCTYNGDLDKEKYVVMTYHDFIAKYPRQLYDIVYTVDNHEEGKIVEIVWDETAERMKYLVEFETTVSWMCADEIFSYVPKDNSDCGTAIKPMKVKSNAVKLVGNKVVDNLDEGKSMNKKLAIKGHPTRGKEIIKLLEMMGGINDRGYIGTNTWKDEYYTLDNGYIRAYDWSDDIKFTLEEFLEKYPFKVGDKVEVCETGKVFTIGNMIWEDELYIVHYGNMEDIEYYTSKELKLYKETNMKTNKCTHCVYAVNNNHCGLRGFRTNFNVNYCSAQNVDKLPNGFELQEDGYFSWVNKKPKYLKTYEECLEYLGPLYQQGNHSVISGYYGDTLEKLQKLLICRKAYWKIAGEEMGLDKSWEPKFGKYILYSIKFYLYQDSFVLHKGEYSSSDNCILVFPTEKMRDAFYENFKKEIEECKELL